MNPTLDITALGVSAQAALARAGWTAQRRIDVDAMDAALRAEGFRLAPVPRAFLERFGDLHFRLEKREHFFQVEELFHLDAAAAARHWFVEFLQECERVAGRGLVPIGEMHDGHMLLMMDEDGRSCAATEQEVFLVGDTPQALLEFFHEPGRSFSKLGDLGSGGGGGEAPG